MGCSDWRFSIATGLDTFFGGGGVVFCVATPECRSDISRCRIQLSCVLSLCRCCTVSVNLCSGVLVWVCVEFHRWAENVVWYLQVWWVLDWLVSVGCPLGCVRCVYGGAHYDST